MNTIAPAPGINPLAQWVPSPNFNVRNGDIAFVVLHHTACHTAAQALSTLSSHNDGGRVSTHYLIGRDGQLLQLVAEAHRAWHAGVGHWAGHGDLNSISIGIANRIADLPDFHAGLDRFVPQERFKEVFSIGTIATHVMRSLLDFFPTGSGWGETVADLLTNGLTFGQILKDLSANQALQDAVADQDRRKTPLYILRVSYLPEDGLRKVGTREITFGQVLAAFGSVQR